MDRITDKYGRILNYVRISVTDRCNFRCRYCMPIEGIPWNPHEKIIKYEDIIFLVDVLSGMGVNKVRFTGGEPLVRRGFSSFLVDLRSSFPDLTLALTTNGSLLSAHKDNLLAANLDSLNVSLDTLDRTKFSYITRTGTLEDVLNGISLFSHMEKPELKINTVLLKGFNDHEIPELIQFSRSQKAILRLIEFMPLDEVWSEQSFISAEEILKQLSVYGKWDLMGEGAEALQGPAKYYRNRDSGQIIGIIAAVSDHFCATCNRLRITSIGEMKPCLFSPDAVALLESIQKRDRQSLQEEIKKAVSLKPSGWMNVVNRGCKMSRVGG